jgi:hypothetical protein
MLEYINKTEMNIRYNFNVKHEVVWYINQTEITQKLFSQTLTVCSIKYLRFLFHCEFCSCTTQT